jgi:hypothetical protein
MRKPRRSADDFVRERKAGQDRSNYFPAEEELSLKEREVLDATLTAWESIKKTFQSWMTIAEGLAMFRAKADKLGGRKAFQKILERNKLGYFASKQGKSTASNLQRIWDKLPEVEAWRKTLTERQRYDWASPRAVITHCPVFKKPKAEGEPPRAPRPVRNTPAQIEKAIDLLDDFMRTLEDADMRASFAERLIKIAERKPEDDEPEPEPTSPKRKAKAKKAKAKPAGTPAKIEPRPQPKVDDFSKTAEQAWEEELARKKAAAESGAFGVFVPGLGDITGNILPDADVVRVKPGPPLTAGEIRWSSRNHSRLGGYPVEECVGRSLEGDFRIEPVQNPGIEIGVFYQLIFVGQILEQIHIDEVLDPLPELKRRAQKFLAEHLKDKDA